MLLTNLSLPQVHFQEDIIVPAINFFHYSFISVSDLLDYITPDAEMKARDAQRKQARAKVCVFYCFLYFQLRVSNLFPPCDAFPTFRFNHVDQEQSWTECGKHCR